MIFGHGKVGKGIVNALESAGTPKKHIVIVETSAGSLSSSHEKWLEGHSLLNKDTASQDSIQAIQSHSAANMGGDHRDWSGWCIIALFFAKRL